MPFERIPNWDGWLVKFADEANGRAFEWGQTDCGTLTRRALTQMLGTNPWDGHLSSWKTKRGAARILKGVNAEDALRASGAVEVPYLFGHSGDVGVGPATDAHGLPALSIMLPGRKALVSTAELGVLILDRLDLPRETRFFRYG